MLPLFLVGWFAKFKWLKPLLIVATAVIVVGAIAWAGATVKGWKQGYDELAVVKPKLEALEAAQEAANKKVIKQAPKDESNVKELVDTKAALAAAQAEISRAWGHAADLEETINAETGCPVVRLSAGYGMCFSATAAGNPADIEACKAAGGDGAVSTSDGGSGL